MTITTSTTHLLRRIRSQQWYHRAGIGRRCHALWDLAYTTYHRIPYRDLYPHFLIIGAQKSGTTSLHYYLAQHPELFMSAFKETNIMLEDNGELGSYASIDPDYYGSANTKKRRFLSDDQILRKMLRGYRGQRKVGDASPYYAFVPIVGLDVPRKSERLRANMQFIYIVRHPIERIASNYKHDLLLFQEKPSMDDWIGRYTHPVVGSSYATQLKAYLELFPLERFHVLQLEDLQADPQDELKKIFRFLGVASQSLVDTTTYYRASAVPLDVSHREKDHLRVTQRVYDRVIKTISREVAELEALLGRDFRWDLSEAYCIG